MIAATEALRQPHGWCLPLAEGCVAFQIGAKNPWPHNAEAYPVFQANAERVLREGEKQEPVGWMADTPHGKIFSDEKAQPGTPRYYWDWVPLYTCPAPSLQAVVEVPEGWQLVPIKPTKEMCEAPLVKGDDDTYFAESLWRGMLAAAPQPPAAPSGDVEALQNIQRYEESDMEGGGVAPSRSGPYVKLADVIAAITATKEYAPECENANMSWRDNP